MRVLVRYICVLDCFLWLIAQYHRLGMCERKEVLGSRFWPSLQQLCLVVGLVGRVLRWCRASHGQRWGGWVWVLVSLPLLIEPLVFNGGST